ncbi:hypothetical protein E4T56_gene12659 [Termitomyces sp. T112]|nr:hypothetical protein E4T56_gene12659 [Termitomyces sp. T112]
MVGLSIASVIVWNSCIHSRGGSNMTSPSVIRQTCNWALKPRQQRPLDSIKFVSEVLPPRAPHVLALYGSSGLAYLEGLGTIVEGTSLADENIQTPDFEIYKAQTARRNLSSARAVYSILCASTIVQATLSFGGTEVQEAKCIFPHPLPHHEDDPTNNPAGPQTSLTVAPHDARHDLEALFGT